MKEFSKKKVAYLFALMKSLLFFNKNVFLPLKKLLTLKKNAEGGYWKPF